jgi:hypothetical protein
MSENSTTADSVLGGTGPRHPRRLCGRARWIAAVLGLALVAFATSAVFPISHPKAPARFSVASTAPHGSAKNTLPTHLSKVFGSEQSAAHYGEVIAKREAGVNLRGQMTSDLTPLSPRAFKPAIAQYRRYAEDWAAKFSLAVAQLQTALRSGTRPAAKRAWNLAFFDFMHLGADYNLLPTGLTDRIAEVPTRIGATNFPGLHRIEMGLWTGQSLRSQLPAARGVATASVQLRHVLPTVPIDVLDYTLRIHEILEDAQRDLLSGTDVPWSGSGILATEAGVAATSELLKTVKPILEGRDNSYGESENWLATLRQTLNSVRLANGSWPTIHQLTLVQRERVDGTLAGTLGALEQVPGALETFNITGFPAIRSDRKKAK